MLAVHFSLINYSQELARFASWKNVRKQRLTLFNDLYKWFDWANNICC